MDKGLAIFFNMFPYMGIALPIVLVVRLIRAPRLKRAGMWTTPAHEILLIVFILFYVGLLSQAILPKLIFVDGALQWAKITGGEPNAIPFRMIVSYFRNWADTGSPQHVILYFCGNIAIFVPLGLIPPLLWRRSSALRGTLLFCAATSAGIETIQIFIRRQPDIDDVMLNVLGGLLGYLIYRAVHGLFPRAAAKCRLVSER